MAVIGTMLSGVGVLINSPRIKNTQYNILKLYGNGTIDKTIVRSYAMTTTELDALTPVNYTFTDDMVLYSEFNNSLQGGSLQTSGEITSWNLFRYCCGSSYPDKKVVGLDGNVSSYIDYTAVKGVQYYYQIIPITSTAAVAALTTNIVEMDYEYWVLIDETTGEAFKFDLNFESSDIVQNDSVTDYQGFSKYAVPSRGMQDYKSFTMAAFLGEITNGGYEETIARYNQLVNFISNGNFKLCKNRSGEVWKVDTRHLRAKIQDQLKEQAKVVTFDVVEVAAVS